MPERKSKEKYDIPLYRKPFLSIEEAVVKLIKKSNSRGGSDNITIAYLKKESGDL